MDTELKEQPDMVALFHDVIYRNKDAAICKCHCHGWIHANQTTDEVLRCYTFPFPLHTVCLSWRFESTNDMPYLTSVYDLALNTISKFKPSQLHFPIRHVSHSSTCIFHHCPIQPPGTAGIFKMFSTSMLEQI